MCKNTLVMLNISICSHYRREVKLNQKQQRRNAPLLFCIVDPNRAPVSAGFAHDFFLLANMVMIK